MGGIENETFEIFDGVSENFVLLYDSCPAFKTVSIYQKNILLFGNKVVVFSSKLDLVMLYDTKTETWEIVWPKNVAKILSGYYCAKVTTLRY